MITSPPDRSPGPPGGSGETPAPARGLRGRLSGAWRKFWGLLTGGAQNPLRTSTALGLGIAVALVVPPPFQTPAVLGLAVLLRLNSLVAFAGTLIWQPFTAPIILLCQHRVGTWLLPRPAAGPVGGIWEPWVKPILVGAPITALAAGAMGTAVCYLALRAWGAVRPDPNPPKENIP